VITTLDTTAKAYLTLDEAAQVARSSKVTLRRAIAARRLSVLKPNGKFGKTLIRPGDLSHYLEGTRRIAVGEHR
jgi:excisionase family DNA binding protein